MYASARKGINVYATVSMETGVEAADPHKLVLMLFEGALFAISEARAHMVRGNIPGRGAAISKAIMIVESGLKASLDVRAGGLLAERLSALYTYICERLLLANARNQPEPLMEAHRLLSELNEAWLAIGHSPAAGGAPEK